MVVRSPSAFARAVADCAFDDLRLDAHAVERAAASVARAGLLVVGEPHGVRETPAVLHALATALGTRALALEWSHEEMDEPVQRFLRSGSFDFDGLWALPPSAEFVWGDGGITAGHFALLRRLRSERRLVQVIPFDRLDPEPPPADWQVRERELAERLLSEWDDRLPLLVLTGAFHALARAPEGPTLTTHLARAKPGLASVVLDYESGTCWSRGRVHDVAGAAPAAAAPTLRLPRATPAVVPGAAGPV
jgi:hypothetical protein